MVDCASMKALPKRKGNAQARGVTAPVENRLNESPSEKEGKYSTNLRHDLDIASLNESPSEKEGKFCQIGAESTSPLIASMKALPKRKGNRPNLWHDAPSYWGASMKALPKRKGNRRRYFCPRAGYRASMKALPKRKGNLQLSLGLAETLNASMKALPKRKGNLKSCAGRNPRPMSLNESPSEKEGKSPATTSPRPRAWAPQ